MVGSIVLSVTFTINRCLLARYSAAVMLKTSVTVTVVLIGVEATPPELMAVIVNVTEIRRSRGVEGNGRTGGTRRRHTQVSLHYSQSTAGGWELQSSSRELRYGEEERCPRRHIGIRAGDQDADIRGIHRH